MWSLLQITTTDAFIHKFYLELFPHVRCKITMAKVVKHSQVPDCRVTIQKGYSNFPSFKQYIQVPTSAYFCSDCWFVGERGHLLILNSFGFFFFFFLVSNDVKHSFTYSNYYVFFSVAEEFLLNYLILALFFVSLLTQSFLIFWW